MVTRVDAFGPDGICVSMVSIVDAVGARWHLCVIGD
jgi:hypothetical protein